MAKAVIQFSGKIAVDEKYEPRAIALLRDGLHAALDPLQDKIAGLEVSINAPATKRAPKR